MFTSYSICSANIKTSTVWKVSKYGVITGPYFPVFSPNTGKYRPEITPYMDTFHAVLSYNMGLINLKLEYNTEQKMNFSIKETADLVMENFIVRAV